MWARLERTWRAISGLYAGLMVTWRALLGRKNTVMYPIEKVNVAPRCSDNPPSVLP